MADKPGVLVISVDMIISSLEHESTVLALLIQYFLTLILTVLLKKRTVNLLKVLSIL